MEFLSGKPVFDAEEGFYSGIALRAQQLERELMGGGQLRQIWVLQIIREVVSHILLEGLQQFAFRILSVLLLV